MTSQNFILKHHVKHPKNGFAISDQLKWRPFRDSGCLTGVFDCLHWPRENLHGSLRMIAFLHLAVMEPKFSNDFSFQGSMIRLFSGMYLLMFSQRFWHNLLPNSSSRSQRAIFSLQWLGSGFYLKNILVKLDHLHERWVQTCCKYRIFQTCVLVNGYKMLQNTPSYIIFIHLDTMNYTLKKPRKHHVTLDTFQNPSEQYIPSTRKINAFQFQASNAHFVLSHEAPDYCRTGNTRPPTSWQALELVAWGVAPRPHSRPLPWEMMGSPWRNGWSCSWYEVEWKLWKLPKCWLKNTCLIYDIIIYYHDI